MKLEKIPKKIQPRNSVWGVLAGKHTKYWPLCSKIKMKRSPLPGKEGLGTADLTRQRTRGVKKIKEHSLNPERLGTRDSRPNRIQLKATKKEMPRYDYGHLQKTLHQAMRFYFDTAFAKEARRALARAFLTVRLISISLGPTALP